MSEMLVVGSKVKAYIKSQGGMTSGELLEALNAKVKADLNRAVERTKGNKRSTVKGVDL